MEIEKRTYYVMGQSLMGTNASLNGIDYGGDLKDKKEDLVKITRTNRVENFAAFLTKNDTCASVDVLYCLNWCFKKATSH